LTDYVFNGLLDCQVRAVHPYRVVGLAQRCDQPRSILLVAPNDVGQGLFERRLGALRDELVESSPSANWSIRRKEEFQFCLREDHGSNVPALQHYASGEARLSLQVEQGGTDPWMRRNGARSHADVCRPNRIRDVFLIEVHTNASARIAGERKRTSSDHGLSESCHPGLVGPLEIRPLRREGHSSIKSARID
jgi:hypothetical protein